jgi:hypothetical protein
VRFNRLPMMKSALFVLPGLLALALAFVVGSVQAAAGRLDRSLAKRGLVETNFPCTQLSAPHAEVGTCEIQ